MHLANSYFGHAAILARHADVPPSRPIFGIVQHGFNGGTGFTPDDPPRRVPAFVWNADNLRRAREAGLAATAIGAPFLYLAEARPAVAPATSDRVVYYPFHGWERDPSTARHETIADFVLDRFGSGTTVCLFFLDHRLPEVRGTYERRGLVVTCHGERSDPDFLARQFDTLAAHDRVVTNVVGTVVWYASALGRSVEIAGPPSSLVGGDDPETLRARNVDRWPELFDGELMGQDAVTFGRAGLGAQFLRTPQELAAILGFSAWRRPAALVAAPVTRGLMKVKRRAEGW